MTISATLQKVQTLLADPANWTTMVFAKDERGNTVDFNAREAQSFCLRGAVARVAGKLYSQTEEYLGTLGTGCLGTWNNNATHDEVMMALDFAILAAKDERK